MTYATTEYPHDAIVTLLTSGPSIAELQQNPVPKNLLSFTGPLPYRMINDALQNF